jgi:hypothetical protein
LDGPLLEKREKWRTPGCFSASDSVPGSIKRATLPMSLVSASKPPYRRSVKLSTKIADSLILAVLNVVLVASGFLVLTTSYAILFIAVFWCALPFSLLFTLGFWVRDIRGAFRRQAKIALLISLPVLLFEIWLLGFHKLDL